MAIPNYFPLSSVRFTRPAGIYGINSVPPSTPEVQKWLTRSIVLPIRLEVAKIRERELTEVSPSPLASTPANYAVIKGAP